MKLTLPTQVETFSLNVYQWFQGTPAQALEQTYKAAIAIQNIETQYFNGNNIGANSTYNPSVTTYFQTKLNQLLRTARWRLAEFRISSTVVSSDSTNSIQGN